MTWRRLLHPWHGLAMLMAAVLLLTLPRAGWAFDVDRSASGAIVRFPKLPVSVYWRPQAVGKLSAAQVESAIQAAIATWNEVPDAKVGLTFGGRVTQPPLFDVYITFDANYDLGKGDPTGWAEATHGDDGKVTRVEIRLNANPTFTFPVLWTLNPNLTSDSHLVADLQGALTHQLGHAIGLGHSRDSSSAMYFFRTDAGQRVLSDDDRRGVRFLWPMDKAAAGGMQCDACSTDADCAQGHCFAWTDGYRHCLRGCEDSSDCPLTTTCGATADGNACLPNDHHCHAEGGQAEPGGLCFADAACPSRHFCSTEGKYGWCTAGCASDAACSGGTCEATPIGQLCRFPGKRPTGGRCLTPSDCASVGTGLTACAPSLAFGGVCQIACGGNAGCPNGSTCGSDGTCAPGGGPLPLGFPCQSGVDCASGQCVATPGGRFAKACSKECTVAVDCPAGTGCSTVQGSSWCLPYGPAVEGSACLVSGSCGGSLVCDVGPAPTVGACAAACDPFAATGGCAASEVCAWVGVASPLRGVCRAAGGAGPGEGCSATSPCRADLVCSGAASEPATCHPVCDPATAGACAFGLVCAAVTRNGQPAGHGACAVSVAPQTAVVAKPAQLQNFAALDGLALPDVVLASHFQGVKPPVSECAAGRSGQGRWAVVGLLLWVGIALRGRRGGGRLV